MRHACLFLYASWIVCKPILYLHYSIKKYSLQHEVPIYCAHRVWYYCRFDNIGCFIMLLCGLKKLFKRLYEIGWKRITCIGFGTFCCVKSSLILENISRIYLDPKVLQTFKTIKMYLQKYFLRYHKVQILN